MTINNDTSSTGRMEVMFIFRDTVKVKEKEEREREREREGEREREE